MNKPNKKHIFLIWTILDKALFRTILNKGKIATFPYKGTSSVP